MCPSDLARLLFLMNQGPSTVLQGCKSSQNGGARPQETPPAFIWIESQPRLTRPQNVHQKHKNKIMSA